MKVALLGNMNNMFFAATRHLRAAGVDAHLFLFDDTPAHFHPAQDSFSLDYQSYTTQLPYGNWQTFRNSPPRAIAEATRGFDFLIGTGSAPALVHRAGKKLDAFLAYGEDIIYFPFWVGLKTGIRNSMLLRHHQREGIRETAACLGATSPRDDALYAKLGRLQGVRLNVTLPTLCSIEFAPDKLPEYYSQSNFYKHFKELRDKSDLLVFNHNRIVIERSVNYKGTEKLIEGFASFAKRHPEVRSTLAMIEYGPDLERARDLVAKLGISNHVKWFPLMARKEALLGLSLADIACGELGYSWLIGCTITECIAMGKPMLHYRKDSDFSADERYPILPAETAAEVAGQLERWLSEPEAVRDVGRQAKLFYDRFINDTALDTVLALIEEKKTFGAIRARAISPHLKVAVQKATAIPAGGDALATSMALYRAKLTSLLRGQRS